MVKIYQIGTEFPRGTFKDFYGHACGISLSSIADARCIWLGRIGEDSIMHLTVDQVKELLPVLQRFVDTEDIAVR